MSSRILVVMGSDSDFPVMKPCLKILDHFGVSFDVRVSSAHRTPDEVAVLARGAAGNGFQLIVAGAGAAAHLAGVFAANTTLPVIGIPIDSSPLSGVDALYATVQMPGGVPVAAMAIGSAGAKNAGIFAVQVLALHDAELARALLTYREEMVKEVAAKNARLQQKLGEPVTEE